MPALTLALLLLLPGCELSAGGAGSARTPVPASAAVPVPPDAQAAVVVRPVDGDTVVLRARGTGPLRREERVRLLLVDAPEVFDEPECFGAEAAERAQELLPRGAQVRVAADRQLRDRFDRPLLHVWTGDGAHVGEVLLREGYATVLHLRPNDRYLPELRAAEQQARAAGRGLWSRCL